MLYEYDRRLEPDKNNKTGEKGQVNKNINAQWGAKCGGQNRDRTIEQPQKVRWIKM